MTNKDPLLKNKRVGVYIAIPNHYSLLDVILKSLKPFDCQITLFISEKLDQLNKETENIVAIEHISSSQWMKSRQFHRMNDQDFIIYDELASFRELLHFAVKKLSVPRLLIVHDCHTWFEPIVPRGLKNYLKYKFTQRVKRKFNVFAVAGSNMKRYLEKFHPKVVVFLIPFRYDDFDLNRDKTSAYIAGNMIRIGIPGIISPRRNYNLLLDHLCIPSLKDKIRIDILGKPDGIYGMKIISRLESLCAEGYHINYSKTFIDHEVFEESIRQTNIIFSDFDPNYRTNNGQSEMYGVSKETGVTSLMLNKAKVGLLPAKFNQMEEIKNQTIVYKDLSEVPGVILSIYNKEINLNEFQKNAVANALNMQISNISNELLNAYGIQQ